VTIANDRFLPRLCGIGQPRLYWNKGQKLPLSLTYKDMFSQFCVSDVQFVSYSLIPLALLSFNLSLGSGHHLVLTTGVMSTLHSSTKIGTRQLAAASPKGALTFLVGTSSNADWFSTFHCKMHKKQEGQHPLTGQRAPPISGGT